MLLLQISKAGLGDNNFFCFYFKTVFSNFKRPFFYKTLLLRDKNPKIPDISILKPFSFREHCFLGTNFFNKSPGLSFLKMVYPSFFDCGFMSTLLSKIPATPLSVCVIYRHNIFLKGQTRRLANRKNSTLKIVFTKKLLYFESVSDFIIFVPKIKSSSSFEAVSTPGQTQTELGPRVYPFTTPECCTA